MIVSGMRGGLGGEVLGCQHLLEERLAWFGPVLQHVDRCQLLHGAEQMGWGIRPSSSARQHLLVNGLGSPQVTASVEHTEIVHRLKRLGVVEAEPGSPEFQPPG